MYICKENLNKYRFGTFFIDNISFCWYNYNGDDIIETIFGYY